MTGVVFGVLVAVTGIILVGAAVLWLGALVWQAGVWCYDTVRKGGANDD